MDPETQAAVRTELLELQGSLTTMNQQLERAFLALSRIEGQFTRARSRELSDDVSGETSRRIRSLSIVDEGHQVNKSLQSHQQQKEKEGPVLLHEPRGSKRPFASTIAQPAQLSSVAQEPRKRRLTTPPSSNLLPNSREDQIGRLALLPDEVLVYIFDLVDLPSLCSLSLVCATTRTLAEGYPWQKFFHARYGTLETSPPGIHQRWKLKFAEARGLVRRWEEPPKDQLALRGHNRPVTYLQFKGNKLLSCDDTVMRQWELSTGKAVVSFATDAKNKCYHFQFDDERLVVSNVDAIRVYDGETSEFLYLLDDVESYANRLKLTSEFIVGGMWDGYIRTWKISDRGSLSAKFFGHLLPVYCLDAVPDKIVSGSSDKWIKVYDAQLQTTLSTLKGHAMTVTTLQLNEKMGCMYSGSRDKCIIRWDMRTRNTPIHRWMGHEDMITSLQFDGYKLVSAGMDSAVKVWDVRGSKPLYTITANEGGVRCLQFSGSDLVIGGSDGAVTIYRYVI